MLDLDAHAIAIETTFRSPFRSVYISVFASLRSNGMLPKRLRLNLALGCSGQVEICVNTGGSGRQDHFLQADVRPRPLLHIFTVVMWLSS
jgi:hypothetical protein